MCSEVEHVLFLFAGRRKLGEILFVDNHMTRRTGHHPFACAFERLLGVPGHVQKAPAGCAFDLAAHATRRSRLACQIVLTEEMKTLSVRVPPSARNWLRG